MSNAFPLWLPEGSKLIYTLELSEATPSNNIIKGMHFFVYKKLRQQWKVKVLRSLVDQGIDHTAVEPIEKAFLSVYRFATSSGLDWDNAYGGLKPLFDCLVCPSDKNPDGLGLIKDDSPKYVPLPPFVQQMKAKRDNSATIVQIYSLEDVPKI